MAQTFNDGESNADVRSKLNGNANELNAFGKFFASVLSQSGTSAPIDSQNKNTTGFSFSWSRTSSGIYVLTCASDLSSYMAIPKISNAGFPATSITLNRTGSTFRIRTYDFSSGSFVLTDDALNGCALKIEFYLI